MAERSTRKRSSKDKNDSIIPIEGRMPPQSIDLEGIVLGAILQAKENSRYVHKSWIVKCSPLSLFT